MAPPRLAKAVKTRTRIPKALSIRNFRIHFIGSVISVPGTWMQLTAQAWLVLELTNSPVALAIVTSLQFLPIFVFSLIGGALADRFPRQKLMFFTQAMGGIQAATLGILCLTGTIQIWHIYVLAVTLGIINALDAPLRQTFVSELVPVSHLPNAIAMTSLAQNLGRIIGPALGGVVIAALGVGVAYFINALTFMAALTALSLLRRGEFQPQRKSGKHNILLQVRDGVAYARRTPTILFLLIATAFIGMFGQNFTTMVPLISTYLVHADAAAFGVLNSCLGTGSFTAALIMTTRGAPSTRRILLAGTGFGIMLVLISQSSSLILSGALFFLVGASAVTFSASVNTLLQLRAPPEMRGRLVSMISLLIPSPIGPMLTGAAASVFGVGWAVLGNGLLCVLGIGVAYAYQLKHRASGTYSEYVAPEEELPAVVAKPLAPTEQGIK